MTLKELEAGKTAIVTAVGGEGALRQHFLDMGVIPGAEVTVVKLAPMVTSWTVVKSMASGPPDWTTVPAGIRMGYPAGVLRRKATTPTARAPSFRTSPRRAAWRSRASLRAVWGKL